jgi:hypothetical protein
VNRVLLTGRLTRDPEMRSLASGKAVTQFSVATNEYIGQGKEKAEYQCKGKVYRCNAPGPGSTKRQGSRRSHAAARRHHCASLLTASLCEPATVPPMSLGVVVKSPSGIVVATDSRVTLTATSLATKQTFPVHYDNATKLMRFHAPHDFVATATFGQAIIPGEQRTAESFLPELEAHLATKRLGVEGFAKALATFYLNQWPKPAPAGPPMIFYVAGFDEGAPYGRVFMVQIPEKPDPEELQKDTFGISWGGQREIVDRIIAGHQNGLAGQVAAELGLSAAQQTKLRDVLSRQQLVIPTNVMALQDCVDLAITLVRTTIRLQQLAVQLRGVGGPVDVVTITRTEGVKVVQFKEVRGEVQ